MHHEIAEWRQEVVDDEIGVRSAVVGEAQMDHDRRRAHGLGAAHRPAAAGFGIAALAPTRTAGSAFVAATAAMAMTATTASAHVHAAAVMVAAASTVAAAVIAGVEAGHRPDEHVGGDGAVEESFLAGERGEMARFAGGAVRRAGRAVVVTGATGGEQHENEGGAGREEPRTDEGLGVHRRLRRGPGRKVARSPRRGGFQLQL